MKIAIIGCGYVGQAVAKLWHQAGHSLTATTTTPAKVAKLQQIASQVVVLKGNDLDALQTVLENQEMILLSLGAKGRDLYREAYLETAQNIRQIIPALPNIKQIIYTSSYAVLGNKNGAWCNEKSPIDPVNENGKILSHTEEVLLATQSKNLQVCILRLGGIYGKGREIINIFRSWAGTTRPGNGEDYSNWIHLDDIVAAVEFLREKQLGGIYNLVHDTPLKRRELLGRLFEIYGLAKVSWDSSLKPTLPYNARISNQKIKDQGYQFIHPEILWQI